MKEQVIERFIRYARIDTQSDPASPTTPSTQKQFDLADLLAKELREMGLKDVIADEHCYVYATIPSNIPAEHPAYGKVPAIGFVAHVDTSPDTTATGCNPQVIENYGGGDIRLGETDISILWNENPALGKCIGHTLITTDGTTLLGSDDKSGVTSIMTLAEMLTGGDSLLHGDIKIGFTPDEEIGRGADKFDIAAFGCAYAYTIDGDMPGALNKETFSADGAWIRCYGKDIHPGFAKGIMVNSIRAMAAIVERLPADMAPETTDGYEPYIHPHSLSGTVFKSELFLLLRDFRTDGLEKQHRLLEEAVTEVRALYPDTRIELEIKKQYRNMHDRLMEDPRGCDYMFEAAARAGVDPYWEPIRGGTDGSRLTEMGLPTPNIFTGGNNFHSKTEWLSVDSLLKTIETMKHLISVWVEKSV